MRAPITQRRIIVARTVREFSRRPDHMKEVLLPETASYYTITRALDQDRHERFAIHIRPLATGEQRDGRRVSRWFKALAPCVAYLRRLYDLAAVDCGPPKVYTQEPHWASGPFCDERQHPAWHRSTATPEQRWLDDRARADLARDLAQVHIPKTIRVGGRDFAPQQAPTPRIDGGAGFGLPGLPTRNVNVVQPQSSELTNGDRAMRARTKRLVGQWWASDLPDEDREMHGWCARHWLPELFLQGASTETATTLLALGADNLRVTCDLLDANGNIVALEGPALEQVRDGD